MKKAESILRKTLEQLNQHDYADLTKFLEGVDWFSVPHEEIVPREKVRAFIKSIKNVETRLNVAKFLLKYEDYYFKEADNGFTANIGPDPVIEFDRELTYLIQQINSNDEFSDRAFTDQRIRIEQLEKINEKLKDEKQKLHQEIETLKSRIDELEHPERKHQIPNELRCEEFYYIITYLQKKGIVIPKPAVESYYQTSIFYRWNSTKALFGYFVCKICYLLELRTRNDHLIWKPFKQAFENFDDLEKQARDIASKNKNWEYSSSNKPDDAYFVDEALKYSEEQMAKSKASKRE